MSINEPFNLFDENLPKQEKEVLDNLKLTEIKIKERVYGLDVIKTGLGLVESHLEIIDTFNQKISELDKNQTTVEKMEQFNEVDEELMKNLLAQINQIIEFISMYKIKETEFSMTEALQYTDAARIKFKNNKNIEDQIDKVYQLEELFIQMKETVKEILDSSWMRLQIMEIATSNSYKFAEFKNKFREVIKNLDSI